MEYEDHKYQCVGCPHALREHVIRPNGTAVCLVPGCGSQDCIPRLSETYLTAMQQRVLGDTPREETM
jgi:hypothetical protein